MMNKEHLYTESFDIVNNIDIRSLAQKYDKRLFHFVLRRLRNEEDARDIVQSTYMEAIKSANNFRHESKPETWLMGIALNLTRNQMHKAYHRYEVSGYNDEDENWLENIAINEQSPEVIAQNKQSIKSVITTFKQMSEEMRETAIMVLVENLSYDYTATEMNIPIGTVRSRVARARQMLKTLQDAA
ncbi:MAG: sigma-70 family RNA polymerase sigma factor [Chitinophagaceae bacterium]